MHPENLDKLSATLKAENLEAVLLASPANITWLTGYASSIQTGPSPFDGGPALGWFFHDQLTLLVNDWEGEAAGATGAQVNSYVGYSVDEPLDVTPRMAAALAEVLKPFSRLHGRIGAELNHLPAALFIQLQASLPEVEIVNLGDDLTPLRMVKTAEEIAKIKSAIRLSDLAQQEIRSSIQPGVTELELYEQVKARVEYEAGGRVPVLLDLVSGERTAFIGGLPTDYALQPGDPLILDFVARLDGYWGDNCAVYFAGEPSTALEKIYQVVNRALRAGVAAVRPGLQAGELDALVRSQIISAGYESYPHHTGHGLGTTYHEEPRIVSYNTAPLQPGMVIAIEPGIYIPGAGGVRLEDVVLVTQDGCEVLTKHLVES